MGHNRKHSKKPPAPCTMLRQRDLNGAPEGYCGISGKYDPHVGSPCDGYKGCREA